MAFGVIGWERADVMGLEKFSERAGAATIKHCHQKGHQLIISPAFETIGNQPVTLTERFAIASKMSKLMNKDFQTCSYWQ